MSDTHSNLPVPVDPNARDTDILGAGFADQLKDRLSLSGAPEDRIIMEVGAEVDVLEQVHKSQGIKPSTKAQVASRRIDGLKILHSLIKERKEDRQRADESALVAEYIVCLKETFKDLSVAPDMSQTILMTLVTKIEEAEKRKTEALRQKQKNR